MTAASRTTSTCCAGHHSTRSSMASLSHRSPCSWRLRASMNGAFANCMSTAGSPCIMPPPGRRNGMMEASGAPS
eukprot:10975698-Lingulodinium_polyedra.AAC.1